MNKNDERVTGFEAIGAIMEMHKQARKAEETAEAWSASQAIAGQKSQALRRHLDLANRIIHHVDPKMAKKHIKPLIRELNIIKKDVKSNELNKYLKQIFILIRKNKKQSALLFEKYGQFDYSKKNVERNLNSHFEKIHILLHNIYALPISGQDKKNIISLLIRIASCYRFYRWKCQYYHDENLHKMHSFWQNELKQPIEIFQLCESIEECSIKPYGFKYYYWKWRFDRLYEKYPDDPEKNSAGCFVDIIVIGTILMIIGALIMA